MRINPKRLVQVTLIGNFLLFVGVAIYIGGDAINGKIEAGRYYVAGHGVYYEVSEAVWRYSRLHALVTIITMASLVVFGLIHRLIERLASW
jgi:hypothetical protein